MHIFNTNIFILFRPLALRSVTKIGNAKWKNKHILLLKIRCEHFTEAENRVILQHFTVTYIYSVSGDN